MRYNGKKTSGECDMKEIERTFGDYYFRSIRPEDKELFMSVRSETSDVAPAYRAIEGYTDYSWDMTLSDQTAVSMMVFTHPEGSFAAISSFQNIDSDAVELGYDLVASYRGKGFGTRIVRELIQFAHEQYPDKKIMVKIRAKNTASLRVIEKCGGILIGTEDTPEAALMQRFLDRDKLSEELPDSGAKEIIERGKNGVKIYRV